MRKLGIGLGVIAGIIVLLYLAYPGATIKYRLSFDVETPEGVKRGSGVVRLHFSIIPQALGATRCASSGVSGGEAVVIDLGERGTMYALLRPQPVTMFVKTLAPHLWSKACERSKIYELIFLDGQADLPDKFIPMLVRFRNEKDPKTIEAVDPANLAASFGDGVALKRVTLETVSSGIWPLNLFFDMGEPVTTGIEKRLVWLLALKGGYLHGGFTSRDAPLGLHGGDFKVGSF